MLCLSLLYPLVVCDLALCIPDLAIWKCVTLFFYPKNIWLEYCKMSTFVGLFNRRVRLKQVLYIIDEYLLYILQMLRLLKEEGCSWLQQ